MSRVRPPLFVASHTAYFRPTAQSTKQRPFSNRPVTGVHTSVLLRTSISWLPSRKKTEKPAMYNLPPRQNNNPKTTQKPTTFLKIPTRWRPPVLHESKACSKMLAGELQSHVKTTSLPVPTHLFQRNPRERRISPKSSIAAAHFLRYLYTRFAIEPSVTLLGTSKGTTMT